MLYRRPIKPSTAARPALFTFIDDAIEALLTILENKDQYTRRIFNIGNPANCISIRELAQRTIRIAQEFLVLRESAGSPEMVDISAGDYYGKYYQDIQVRVPNVEAARRDLAAQPSTDMDTVIRKTIAFYVNQEGWASVRSGDGSRHEIAAERQRAPTRTVAGRAARLARLGAARGGLVRHRAAAAVVRPRRRPLRRDSAVEMLASGRLGDAALQ